MPEDKPNISRVSNFNELGKTGLQRTGGVIYEEFLPQLRGSKGAKVYREIRENSAIVGSMMFAIESLLRSVTWRVEPASDSAEDLAAAQFLEEARADMDQTWEDFISEALSMLVYGWSYFEVVYKKRDGKKSQFSDGRIGWKKFAIRDQQSLWRWYFDDSGDVIAFQQAPQAPDYQEIPIIPMEKSVLFRTTSYKNNPEGRSVLRSAYRSWYFQKRLEEIEAIGIERDLAGMPIAHVPIEILANDRGAAETSIYNSIKDIVTRVKRDEQEGIIFPLQYDENGKELYRFELLSSGGQRQVKTGEIIQRYSQQIAMSTLADFILLGHENVGSFALSSDKTELFAVALGSWLDAIEETLNRKLVSKLFKLNPSMGVEANNLPQLRHGDIESPDLQELAAFLSQTAQAGAPWFPNLQLENKLADLAGLPEADPEEREAAMAAGAAMPGAPMSGQPGQQPQQGGGQPDPSIPPPLPGFQSSTLMEPFAKSEGEPTPTSNKKRAVNLKPTVYNGTRWKTIQGRHRWGGGR